MKKFLFWLIALVITLAAAVYQRVTGPTYPARVTITAGKYQYLFHLPRSHNSDRNCPIELPVPDTAIHAVLQFKRYPTNEAYQTVPFTRSDDILLAEIPAQPPAGKVEYQVLVFPSDKSFESVIAGPVIIRFKGPVPAWVLIPHILLMFFAMWISNLTGLFALGRRYDYRPAITATLILLFIGGLIMGPVVQKYAFGALWTGFPFGYDLTDNKTLIAFVFWLIAWAGNRKKQRRGLVILAAVIQIVVYSIPHSLLGSELHYETGQVVTGMIPLFI